MPSAFCHQTLKHTHALLQQFSPFALCPVLLALSLALGKKGGDYQDLCSSRTCNPYRQATLLLNSVWTVCHLCGPSPQDVGINPSLLWVSANPLYFLLYVPVLLKGIDENNLLTDRVKIKWKNIYKTVMSAFVQTDSVCCFPSSCMLLYLKNKKAETP